MPKRSRNSSSVAAPKNKASDRNTVSVRQDSSQRLTPSQKVNISDYAIDLQDANTQLRRMLRRQGIADTPSMQNNRKEQSAARTRLRSLVAYPPSGTSKQKQSTRNYNGPQLSIPFGSARQTLDCLGRKVRRELVHAFGGGGSRKKQPNRRTASKTRC